LLAVLFFQNLLCFTTIVAICYTLINNKALILVCKFNFMTTQSLKQVGKKVFFVGFLGSCLASVVSYIGRQPGAIDSSGQYMENPYHSIMGYTFGVWLVFLVLLFIGCWMVLQGKKQKLGLMWILLLVPIVNLIVLKKVFDLPDLSGDGSIQKAV
jgi:hypothetical protein